MSSNQSEVLANTTETLTPLPFLTRQNPIADDYELSNETLGEGANGEVWKCEHRVSGQKYALKILIDSNKHRQEVIMHKKACENCQYIVQVIDVYENIHESNQCLLIVMERMEGGELFERIQRRHEYWYAEREAARLISMIVPSVAHLHAIDIAHCDLKPKNLLFTSRKNDAILKLADFGFAKEVNNEQEASITPCGTIFYVAPEVLSRTRCDKACDIWALGVIMYLLLCGFLPFDSDNSAEMNSIIKEKIKTGEYQFDKNDWIGISEEAKSTIKRMLIVDPAQRMTINEIANCSWLTRFTSGTAIDLSSFYDAMMWHRLRAALCFTNDIQRRSRSESQMFVFGLNALRIRKRRTLKRSVSEHK